MSETVWQRSDDWVGAVVEDSFVMVSIEDGKYVSLNPTANAVWQALEEPRTEPEIRDALLAQFDVAPDACADSVARALETMRDMGLASPR